MKQQDYEGIIADGSAGLNIDDQNLHADRIKLWNDFNHAWLALFQRQKDMMESGQPPVRSQSLISKDGLEKMGKELVRLCDGIERHGLVDYQYGVWEEQIIASKSMLAAIPPLGEHCSLGKIAVLTDCLDVYEAADDSSKDEARAGSSSHLAGR